MSNVTTRSTKEEIIEGALGHIDWLENTRIDKREAIKTAIFTGFVGLLLGLAA